MNLRRIYNYLKFLDPMDTKRSPFVSPANYGSHKFPTSMVRFIRSFRILSTYESFESRSLDLSARRYLCPRLKALKSSASVCLTIWFGHRAARISRTCVSTRQTLNCWLIVRPSVSSHSTCRTIMIDWDCEIVWKNGTNVSKLFEAQNRLRIFT